MLLLPELLKDWPCTVAGGEYRVNVTGITENSMNVKRGNIFVARRGHKEDGSRYIIEAIRNGAAAIVIDRPTSNQIPGDVPVVTVADCRRFISHASAVFAGNPSERLTVIAVTGTNGKTTVSHFIGQMLKQLGAYCAVIGTTGIFIDGKKIEYASPNMTTLPAEFLHPLLKKCEDEGVTHIVLEASSLGLSMHRLAHCAIDIGILLNVGKDHYDEHGGKQQYIEAKRGLVDIAQKLVVNGEDEVCVEIVKTTSKPCLFIGNSLIDDVRLIVRNDSLFVKCGDVEGHMELLVPGEFNRLNAVAAIGALHGLSYRFEDLLRCTASLKLPEGRMQSVTYDGVSIVVDYAHTPDALEVVLRSLSKTCKGNLLTVFGCGGDRDKGKRGEMGRVVAMYSSRIFVTSDNPRNEDPLTIISDIMTGIDDCYDLVNIEPNRERAIQNAITCASTGDVVLIAGKGHEKTQHTAAGIFQFSDLEVAKLALLEGKQNRWETI